MFAAGRMGHVLGSGRAAASQRPPPPLTCRRCCGDHKARTGAGRKCLQLAEQVRAGPAPPRHAPPLRQGLAQHSSIPAYLCKGRLMC